MSKGLCLENAYRGSGTWWNPCLREKGHAGSHRHMSLCNSVSCSCGGLLGRMTSEDLMKYRGLQDLLQSVHKAMHLMEMRYYREEGKK